MRLRPRLQEHPGYTVSVALRRWWLRVVVRHDGESCQMCGRRYDDFLWWAPGDLWWEVMRRESGLLCPRCFTEMARDAGLLLTWRPIISSVFTEDGERLREWTYGELVGDDFLRERLLQLFDAMDGIRHNYDVSRMRAEDRGEDRR